MSIHTWHFSAVTFTFVTNLFD